MRLQEVVNRNRTTILFAAIAVFCLISLGVSSSSAQINPGHIATRVFTRIQAAVFSIGDFVSRTVSSVQELGRVRAEYAALLARAQDLEEARSDLEALRAENAALKEALDFHSSLSTENIPARVIGKEPGNLFSTLTIDCGSRDGVLVDSPVIAMSEGSAGLVGKVTEVYAESALVLPILDPAVYVAARLAESRYEGLVNGNGQRAGNLLMRYVDRQARFSVESSDLVVTSGMRSIYPAGLRIGMVTAIQGRSYESSLEIDLDPIVDFPRLEYVFVLVPGGAQ